MIPETSRSRDSHKVSPGKNKVGGDAHIIAEPENGLGWFLKWVTGGDVTSVQGDTSGVYKHTFAFADIIKSFTGEIGADILARKVTSMMMDKLTFESEKGGFLGLTLGILGQKEEKATIGTPTFSDLKPFSFPGGSISIAAADKSAIVEAVRFSIGNSIPYDELYSHGSEYIRRIEVGDRVIEGSLDLYFEDDVEYDRFLAGTEFVLDLAWEGEDTDSVVVGYEKYKLAFKLHRCLYLRDTAPHVDRKERMVLAAPFKAFYSTTEAEVMEAFLINKVTSYPNA